MATKEKTKEEHLQDIGQSAYESIVEMVKALQCDFDELESLREECDDWDDEDEPDWAKANTEDAERLAELEEAAGDCESEEAARERIEEDPLSLQLRSGWYCPGDQPEPEEFELLLGTGGPAVRIIGTLGQFSEPESATLQSQDWFTPWTDYRGADEDILLAYCRCFYFGE